MIKNNPHRILISRTDNIGDVILTLPMAGIIKKYFPDSIIYFLGKKYTEPIIKLSKHIDHFLNWDEIKINQPEKFLQDLSINTFIHVFPNKEIAQVAKKAKIKNRIGTSHRIYHWWTCNQLVNVGRKKSNLHEAQLNIQLLSPLSIPANFQLEELVSFYGFPISYKINESIQSYIDPNKYNFIFHAKSNLSAREWPALHYLELAKLLDPTQFAILITGTSKEKEIFEKECPAIFQLSHVKSTMGKFSLDELIQLIQATDGLIAASTGPLHLAAAFGKIAIGLYPSMRPVHPERWKPIGVKAIFLESKNYCNTCKNKEACDCLEAIHPTDVQVIIKKTLQVS